MYEFYEPLRDHLRRASLLESLAVIHAYLQNMQFNQPFPADIEVHASYRTARAAFERPVHEWQLELLAKELILNAPLRGERDFRTWDFFADAVNKLLKLEDETSGYYQRIAPGNVFLELHRIAHRQFPWQQKTGTAVLMRHFKVFSFPALNAVLQASVGLNAEAFYKIGLALSGHFLERFDARLPFRVDMAGITADMAEVFIKRVASDFPTMRAEIVKTQRYDRDYAYAFNPLRVAPLLHTERAGKAILIAPVPSYLIHCFTEGTYYAVVNAAGFADAFGAAFQHYISEVLDAANKSGVFSVLPEVEYREGTQRKQSVDWIVSDGSGTLFVECKTKRLQFASKMTPFTSAALEDDLTKLAASVVQVYKTLRDALDGLYPHWKPTHRPVYPIVLTLEDWYAFGNRILGEVDDRVRRALGEIGLDPAIVDESPYTVCASAEFERAIQVASQVGIERVMRAKVVGERRLWTLHSLLVDEFREELSRTERNLFSEAFDRLGESESS